ncbi:MAG TPA: heme exporter protein CcmD [Xanthobacteraceae bacterium]|nr:heme exporter protein CcmD [Xanthobacteraceae bacterium]
MVASHFTFVAVAYGFAALVFSALLLWIALDYRTQKKRLAALEAQRAREQ